MPKGGRVSLAQLKRELDSLSQQIFQIDLKIQQFRQQNNTQNISNLEAAKKELQQQILQNQIALEWQQAQNKKARR